MTRNGDGHAAGDEILRASTAIANEFVRIYASGRHGRTNVRHISQDTYQVARDTIELLGHALAEGRPVVEMPPTRGARAALRGKHMAHSLDWIGLLERVVTNHLYADSSLATADAKTGVMRLALLFDSIYRQELDAFRAVQEQVSGWQSRVATGLVTYLLSGAPVEPAALVEQARTLGVDPHQPFRAVVFAHRGRPTIAAGAWTRTRGRILDVLWQYDERREALLLDRPGLLAALVPEDRPGPGVVALLDELLADPELGDELFAACTDPDESLITSGRGLRRAVAALEICVHRNRHGSVTNDSQVALDVLLAQNEPVARSLVATSVGPLVERPPLLQTLRAYLDADLSLQRTADLLGVHQNTVVYRLRQIAELTGADMRSIGALTAFSNGLVALDLLATRESRDPDRLDDLRAALLSGG